MSLGETGTAILALIVGAVMLYGYIGDGPDTPPTDARPHRSVSR